MPSGLSMTSQPCSPGSAGAVMVLAIVLGIRVEIALDFRSCQQGRDARRALECVVERKGEVRHMAQFDEARQPALQEGDRKSTRLNSSHVEISYAVFCLKKKKKTNTTTHH